MAWTIESRALEPVPRIQGLGIQRLRCLGTLFNKVKCCCYGTPEPWTQWAGRWHPGSWMHLTSKIPALAPLPCGPRPWKHNVILKLFLWGQGPGLGPDGLGVGMQRLCTRPRNPMACLGSTALGSEALEITVSTVFSGCVCLGPLGPWNGAWIPYDCIHGPRVRGPYFIC